MSEGQGRDEMDMAIYFSDLLGGFGGFIYTKRKLSNLTLDKYLRHSRFPPQQVFNQWWSIPTET